MDLQRFGLKRRPFPSSPDSMAYYPASSHESALTLLVHGLAEDETFVLLTGEPGTGKTLLAYLLLERLGDSVENAYLANSHFADRCALLQAILYDLKLPYDDVSEQRLRLRITDHLLQAVADGKRTVFVIDEAHLLGTDVLEELRMLANLQTGGGKALQIVLIAQPTLLTTLAYPGLESLRQRIAVRATLAAMPAEEAYDYLAHHLRAAGGKPEKIFDDTALEVLARGTHGVPRYLNQAASQALALAENGELTTVDAEAALEALAMLGLSVDEADEKPDNDGEPTHPNIQKFFRTA
ncbi:MAG: AAA family ATPase [Gemmataceae bacterium]|nr:AAA family ATPase [Gemmataceae bacterium]